MFGGYYCCTLALAACLFGGTVADRPSTLKRRVYAADSLSIQCKMSTLASGGLRWSKDGANLTQNDRVSFAQMVSGDKTLDGYVLKIKDIVRSDAGRYRCSVNQTSWEFELHVFGTTDGLWPFIGVCLEAGLLTAIILTCEKYGWRRLLGCPEEAAAASGQDPSCPVAGQQLRPESGNGDRNLSGTPVLKGYQSGDQKTTSRLPPIILTPGASVSACMSPM